MENSARGRERDSRFVLTAVRRGERVETGWNRMVVMMMMIMVMVMVMVRGCVGSRGLPSDCF